jgi:hypothetical protein
LQVGQEGDIGAEVVAAGAAESVGQAFPPALTLEGSAQTPKGTATWPTLRRACSESSSAWAWRQMRLPCRSNWRAETLSTASRRRFSPTFNGGVGIGTVQMPVQHAVRRASLLAPTYGSWASRPAPQAR